MSHVTDSFSQGYSDALDAYGVKVSFTRGMPQGPDHLAVERLARMLGDDQEDYTRPFRRRDAKSLSRPVSWGPPTSLEGNTAQGDDYSGMGPYGGV